MRLHLTRLNACTTMNHSEPRLDGPTLMPTKTRFSVALDDREYSEIMALAEKNRVSMAWLVRHAVAAFLERSREEDVQLPLRLTSDRSEPRR